MATKDNNLYVDFWHKKGVSTNELYKIHRQLAKRSNQRLVRLERAVSVVTGESYASYGAGDIAKEYLTKQGRNRFRETAQSQFRALDNAQARHELLKDIKAMQKFLTSKSSTVKGQKAIEKKRLKTLAEQTDEDGKVIRKGLKFESNKEFFDFLNSKTFEELAKTFDSNTIVEIYDESRDVEGMTQEKIADALEDFRKTKKQDVKKMRKALGLKAVK